MDFSNVASPRARRALHHVADRSTGPALGGDLRITLNFHPDRLTGALPILQALAQDGAYHSQFVTGTGNGGVELGARIAQDGHVDPRIIGDAARTGRDELQHLKMVWHTVARFGAPEGAGTAYAPGGHTPGVRTPSA